MQILIIIIGIFLIAFNYKAVRNEKNTFNKSLSKAENGINDSDIEIGLMRKEFAETILELQQDIEELKDEIKNLKSGGIQSYEEPQNIESSKDNINKNDNISKIEENNSLPNNVKIDEIDKLLKDGLSVEEIAERLAIGKGEVLLIKGLFIK